MEIKSKTSIYLNADQQQTVRDLVASFAVPELDTTGKLFIYMCEHWNTRPAPVADNSEAEVLKQQLSVLQEENNRLTAAGVEYESNIQQVKQAYENDIQNANSRYETAVQDANNRYATLHTQYEELQTQYTAATQEPPPAPVLTVKPKFNPLKPWESF